MKKKKTSKTSELNKPDVSKINFQYVVETDYDTETNCDEGCEPYCRCGRIVNAKVTVCDASQIAGCINQYCKFTNPVMRYCLWRLLVVSKIDSDSFAVITTSGYYGEEIEGVYLEDEKLIKGINTLCSADKVSEAMEYVLSLEYGEVLPRLEDQTWVIKTVPLSCINLPTTRPHVLDEVLANIKYYEQGGDMPIGLCLPNGILSGRYNLVDGYHRYFYAKHKAEKDPHKTVAIVTI